MPWVDIEAIEDERPSQRDIEDVIAEIRVRRKARLFADADFPAPAVKLLRELRFDVVTAYEKGTSAHPDENHVATVRRLKRMLVTCDRDYLDERRFPLIQSPAIAVFPQKLAEFEEALPALYFVKLVPGRYDKELRIDAKQGEWKVIIRHQDGSTTRKRYRFHNDTLQLWVDIGG